MKELTNILAINFPDLAKEWHPTRNGDLTPYCVKSGSNKKVWWQCSTNSQHQWISVIFQRTRGVGCPFCTGKIVSEERSLATLNPVVSSEWHPIKNGELTPKDVSEKSNKSVWWQCPKVENHEWIARISNRVSGNGCPFCAGKKASPQTSLRALHSQLSSEWHPSSKNGNLTPDDVTPGSNKKVWWQCSKNPNHEWQSMIVTRTAGKGCPFCAKERK
jgi:hypothetical protein